MNVLLVYIAFLAAAAPEREAQIQTLIAGIAQSGSVLELADRQARIQNLRHVLAPGSPPLLSFRYFHGADKGRYGKLDLMLDDAGH